MLINRLRISYLRGIMVGLLPLAALLVLQIAAAKNVWLPDGPIDSTAAADVATAYQWNIGNKELPLIGFNAPRLNAGFDQSLGYPTGQFDLAIFRSLSYDEEGGGKYLLPALTKERHIAFIELTRTGVANTFMSVEGIQLIEKSGMKVVKTADGTSYLFTQYPDGEFRCSTIKRVNGPTLFLLYTANGLVLHGVSDSAGRSVTFNYGKHGMSSLTQTWMSNLEGVTRTWSVGDETNDESSVRYAHAIGLKSGKFLPGNALVREYTGEMAECDKFLARIFGGPTAVAGANGFEPAGLGTSYPLYRGDTIGDDGKLRHGHLSHAMHLYGTPDGRGDSPLYVPAGFTSHSGEPTPTDAAVTFYYPRLGNLTDVTLAVFHIADFQITADGDRVRIGNIGGPGGSSPLYRHSHIEFYKGNVGLPAAAARAALRINPATVFGK
ncbi:MAG TPA: hypothetical protein VE961_23920 [Pyrinomonadaceae bacterium]|nr:hypothetical protein [Pyrinomonadaceae bacterium]